MNSASLAKLIDGRQFDTAISFLESEMAREFNLVVCFGLSDDLLEFVGAVTTTLQCKNGTTITIDENGNAFDSLSAHNPFGNIHVTWQELGLPSWLIESDIVHHKFTLFHNQHAFSQGIVFSLDLV